MKNKTFFFDDSDEYARYLSEIAKFPILTAQEERELAVEAKNGSRDAFEKLINSSLRLSAFVAKKYYYSCVDMFDLVQSGNIGLVEAAKRYDPNLGFRFSTYAVPYIKKECIRFIAEMRYPVSLRTDVCDDFQKIRSIAENSFGKDVTDLKNAEIRKISEICNIRENRVGCIIRACVPGYSLDIEVGEGEDMQIFETIPDENERTPEEELFHSEAIKEVRKAVLSLPLKKREVINERFGLDGNPSKTLREIGDRTGCSREAIRMMEVNAIKLLRKEVNNHEKYNYL